MDSDKNNNTLEKQLKTLGQKIRVDILKKLNNTDIPLSFSKLQKTVLENNLSSVNFSFHLNALKKCDLISVDEEGYYITRLGKQITNKILAIKQILDDQNKVRMIRTSKYSKELFDINKIEEYLINEGELEPYLARQIAREVEERLSRTSIEYLTAPLMREYINAVLLESGLEEVRHKLTRLGTPPFEAFKLFNSTDNSVTPEKFIKRLGSDVSEQFLLLNLIPKNLADLYLSGEIALLHLNYWSLRPLSFYINAKTLFDTFSKTKSNQPKTIEKRRDMINLILNSMDFLYRLKQYYSEGLLLGDFNNQFLSFFNLQKDHSHFFNILTSQLQRFNNSYNDNKSHLSLEFKNVKSSVQCQIEEKFLHFLENQVKTCVRPLICREYSNLIESKLIDNVINDYISNSYQKNFIFFRNSSNLLNSNIIKIKNPEVNNIILDKILINLHTISLEASQNDDLFLDLLQDKIESVFNLFHHKKLLIKKKLCSIKDWNNLVSIIFSIHEDDLYKNAIKSISFFGLNEAILNHCGIEIDRTENSELFALKILSFMKKLIKEKNKAEDNNYILSQPHYDSYLKDSWRNGISQYGKKINYYTSTIIRDDSTLSLDKKIAIFKKFEKILDGGIIFYEKMNNIDFSIKELLKLLFESKINAISLRNNSVREKN